jgi:hypothetical protein
MLKPWLIQHNEGIITETAQGKKTISRKKKQPNETI